MNKFKDLLLGIGLGISLGFCWVPCAGPLMASALTNIYSGVSVKESTLLFIFYVLGICISAAIIMFSSKYLIKYLTILKKYPRIVNMGIGLLLIINGVYLI